jgi:hypothetical protein
MCEMDEMPRAERIWTRADWMVGVVAAFVAGVVYFWTAAPNVTLLDSGEFVVAAPGEFVAADAAVFFVGVVVQ